MGGPLAGDHDVDADLHFLPAGDVLIGPGVPAEELTPGILDFGLRILDRKSRRSGGQSKIPNPKSKIRFACSFAELDITGVRHKRTGCGS
jgi:hypothetical protein